MQSGVSEQVRWSTKEQQNSSLYRKVLWWDKDNIEPHETFFSSCPLTWELAPILEHRADSSVSRSFTVSRTHWTGDQLVARPLPKHRTTQTQKNADTHKTSIPRWDSNPQSRRPSDRSLFMPQTAQLPRLFSRETTRSSVKYRKDAHLTCPHWARTRQMSGRQILCKRKVTRSACLSNYLFKMTFSALMLSN
jgi:hypothetical protein